MLAPKVKTEQELDEETALDRDTHVARDRALQTDLTLRAGRRHTIRFQQALSNDNNHKFYKSIPEAVADLEGTVLQHCAAATRQKLKQALEYGLLEECLRSMALPNIHEEHKQFVQWLTAVAQSAGFMRSLGDAARVALERAVLQGEAVQPTQLSRLASLLQCWDDDNNSSSSSSGVGDDADSKPAAAAAANTATAEEAMPADAANQEKNIDGLVNCLLLWEQAIPFCAPDPEACTKCLRLLVRFGLDLDFHRLDVLGRVVAALIAVQEQQQQDSGTNNVVHAVLEGLTSLGPGLTDDDFDDTEGWLVLSAALRLVPLHPVPTTATAGIPPQRAVLRFHAALSLHAVQLCLPNSNTHLEAELSRVLQENPALSAKQQNSTAWKTLSTVYAGLLTLERYSNATTISQDPSRVQAVVECLFAAFESGLLLLALHDNDGVADYFALLDPAVEKLESRFKTMATLNPIRKADMLLMLWHQYNIIMHRQASVTQQQKTMDAYFKPMSPTNSPRMST